jgi:hypothetical protein
MPSSCPVWDLVVEMDSHVDAQSRKRKRKNNRLQPSGADSGSIIQLCSCATLHGLSAAEGGVCAASSWRGPRRPPPSAAGRTVDVGPPSNDISEQNMAFLQERRRRVNCRGANGIHRQPGEFLQEATERLEGFPRKLRFPCFLPLCCDRQVSFPFRTLGVTLGSSPRRDLPPRCLVRPKCLVLGETA